MTLYQIYFISFLNVCIFVQKYNVEMDINHIKNNSEIIKQLHWIFYMDCAHLNKNSLSKIETNVFKKKVQISIKFVRGM